MNMLSSSGNLRKENFVVSDIFQRDHKICLIQDIKHVLKKIRNSILASRLEYEPKPGRFIVTNSRPIVWNHWENAYKYNVKDGLPIHKFYRGVYCGNPSLKNEESFSIRCPKQRNVVFDAMLSKYS